MATTRPTRSMRAIAAATGASEPRLVEWAHPGSPGDNEVLCQTVQLGICGTDREILISERPFVPPGETFLILGHECLGRVVEVGKRVSSLHPGDLVVPVVRRPRSSDARYRVDMLAFGEFTERGIVYEHGFSCPFWRDQPEFLVPVPARLESIAVFTEPLAVAEKGVNEALAIQRGRLGADAWSDRPPRVLVTGMGPIGFAAVLACTCRGWPVWLYGRDAADTFRARLAQSLGATYLPATDIDRHVRDVEASGFDIVLECTGADEVMVGTAEALASRGVMVWLGSSRIPEAHRLNVESLMRNGIIRNHVHVGCVNAAPRDFHDALRHLEQSLELHPDSVQALFTHRISPEESLEHLLQRYPQSIKTVLMYDR